jgi:branched-chain amino acid transport system permease protein
MYAAVTLFATLRLDPFLAIVPVAVAFFALGYGLQTGLINPFITRPEHSQFILLVAVAIIMANGLLMIFGPDARNVQTDYQLESFALGPLLFDEGRVYAAGAALAATALLLAIFRPAPTTIWAPRSWASTSSTSTRSRSAWARPASRSPAVR